MTFRTHARPAAPRPDRCNEIPDRVRGAVELGRFDQERAGISGECVLSRARLTQ